MRTSRAVLVGLFALLAVASTGMGQTTPGAPAGDSQTARADDLSPAAMQMQIDALRREMGLQVELRQQLADLENQLTRLSASERPQATDGGTARGLTSIRQAQALRESVPAGSGVMPGDYAVSGSGAPAPLPLFTSYGYNFAGGYSQFATSDGDFTIKLQNQLTLDGTFYDRSNMPTAEKGFNIPFFRSYLFGNITPDWEYQFSVQGFLGEFNLLDAWVDYAIDDALHIRAGRQLSPLLYEYFAFSPAWEPVMTNSLLFQVAGKRQMGVMAWGRLAENRFQYQAGVFNGIEGGFYDLDRSVDFIATLSATPWKDGDELLDSLGVAVGVQTGMQNYALNEGNTAAFINGAGEPTLNFNYINSTGIPFFQYDDVVAADGPRTRVAPSLFWYGRWSMQAEYLYQTRTLAENGTRGTTTLHGYQATVAWLATGETRRGDGLLGWTTVEPRAPFSPGNGEYGPGAWELAAQYSELNVGTENFALGFADPATSTNRIHQTMLGVNWWPNRYTRLSFDWMNNGLNRPVPIGGRPLDQINTFWVRAAMFF